MTKKMRGAAREADEAEVRVELVGQFVRKVEAEADERRIERGLVTSEDTGAGVEEHSSHLCWVSSYVISE